MKTPNPDAESPDQSFPKELRLRATVEYQRVYQFRRSVSDDVLILYAAPNDLPHARFGASVSRKVGNAVHRNRWKRALREAFRLTRQDLPTGLDYVAIPRGPLPPPQNALQQSLTQLARRAKKRTQNPR